MHGRQVARTVDIARPCKGDTAKVTQRKLGANNTGVRTTPHPAAVTPPGTEALELTGAVDPAAEKARLAKEIEKTDQVIAGSEAKLANEAFTAKAPAAILDGARAPLADNKAKRDERLRLIASLG